jgi:GAF domain-containing protein
MSDALATEAIEAGGDPAVRAILDEACRVTQMGFAALACVTEDRWIACQVVDKIDFGLDPGDELDIKKTICNDVRECGQAIVIDEVAVDPEWCTHPVPALYGFQSYASLPVFLGDGSFYGTLCALDPKPRALTARDTVERLRELADRLGEILSVNAPNEA